MAAASTITVSSITVPASNEDMIKYKTIRLAMLSTNPEAFGSRYETQVLYTDEKWREIVNTRGRTTLYAVAQVRDISDESSPEDDEWIGSLSILTPEMLVRVDVNDMNYPSIVEEGENGGYIDVYMLIGMWVHPKHRGRGVGRALVERALEEVQYWMSPGQSHYTSSQNSRQKEKVLMLEVHNGNEAAKRLYLKAGFIAVDTNSGGENDDGKSWMQYSVKN